MLFRLTNCSQGQMVLEVLRKVETDPSIPLWKTRRLMALQSTSRYLIPASSAVEAEFADLEECMSQPQIKKFHSEGRLQVVAVEVDDPKIPNVVLPPAPKAKAEVPKPVQPKEETLKVAVTPPPAPKMEEPKVEVPEVKKEETKPVAPKKGFTKKKDFTPKAE